MTYDDDPGRDAVAASHHRLAAHVEECAACRAECPPVERIALLLTAGAVAVDTRAMSQRILMRLRPELARRAAAVLWPRVAVGVLLATLPLPAVLAYNAYLLRLAYDVARQLLPAAFAAYLVLSCAAFLALLFAATYAAIPICLARGTPPRQAARVMAP